MAMDDRFARVLTDPRFKVSKDFLQSLENVLWCFKQKHLV